jgi:hypothetical protein
MKSKMILSIMVAWTAQSFADQGCKTIWVYHPYKTCALQENGMDMSQPQGEPTHQVIASGWHGGHEGNICGKVATDFNNVNLGQFAEPEASQPPPDTRKNGGVYVEYNHACHLTITKYPVNLKQNVKCGSEDSFAYSEIKSSTQGASSCLSCDNLDSAALTQKVACLKSNIKNLDAIKASNVSIREEDMAQLKAQVDLVKSLGGMNLSSDDLSTLNSVK